MKLEEEIYSNKVVLPMVLFFPTIKGNLSEEWNGNYSCFFTLLERKGHPTINGIDVFSAVFYYKSHWKWRRR